MASKRSSRGPEIVALTGPFAAATAGTRRATTAAAIKYLRMAVLSTRVVLDTPRADNRFPPLNKARKLGARAVHRGTSVPFGT
jgi:hypothetical protein